MADIRILNLPLDPDIIRKLNGKFDYVEPPVVVRILDAAYDCWNFEIVDKRVDTIPNVDIIFTVHGRITATYTDPETKEKRTIVREAMASDSLAGKMYSGSRKSISSFDELTMSVMQTGAAENMWKMITTDCFKKAASLAGVALEIYGKDSDKRIFAEHYPPAVVARMKELKPDKEQIVEALKSLGLGRNREDLNYYNAEKVLQWLERYSAPEGKEE